jgi:hypothetical protein
MNRYWVSFLCIAVGAAGCWVHGTTGWGLLVFAGLLLAGL